MSPAGKSIGNSSPVALGLAIFACAGVLAAGIAWGDANSRLGTVEKAEQATSKKTDEQERRNNAQDLSVQGLAKDMEATLNEVRALNRRQEKWEERGFVRQAGGGR